MKSFFVLMFVIVFFPSCGRRDTSTNTNTDCRSRESMRIECQVVNTPNYGRPYAQELCNRTYTANKCY